MLGSVDLDGLGRIWGLFTLLFVAILNEKEIINRLMASEMEFVISVTIDYQVAF